MHIPQDIIAFEMVRGRKFHSQSGLMAEPTPEAGSQWSGCPVHTLSVILASSVTEVRRGVEDLISRPSWHVASTLRGSRRPNAGKGLQLQLG